MNVNVKVITKSSCNKVEKIDNNNYKVKITIAPERGKANKKIVGILSEYFDVPKSKMQIIKGETSQDKIIQIQT